MDQPSENQRKLDDLPESGNEFWDGEKYKGIPEAVNSEGPHTFERIRVNEAYCRHCGWGFWLDRGDYIEGGHVYTATGTLVI